MKEISIVVVVVLICWFLFMFLKFLWDEYMLHYFKKTPKQGEVWKSKFSDPWSPNYEILDVKDGFVKYRFRTAYSTYDISKLSTFLQNFNRLEE